MLILLGITLGNLCAIAVHVYSWNLRHKCLPFMMGAGFFSFVAFVGLVRLWVSCEQLSSPYASTPNPSPQSIMRIEAFQASVAMLGWKMIFGAVVVTGIVGLLQMRQIPAKWWQAVLALWGEIGFWIIGYFAFGFTLGDVPGFTGSIILTFFVVDIVLAVLRPLCLRWARPVWQVVNELKIRKV
jgi:hypothetical protein